MQLAAKCREHAHCPYSNFRVGSAVLCEDGSIFTGCNVENACYGLSMCGERVAIMKAVSEGHKDFKAIAVCCDIKGAYKASCGACRQFIAEFGMDWDMYLVKPDMTWKKISFEPLLPMAFTPASLELERV
ncbi:hypothetical protein NP493_545g01123 [Ridgeia piscesae]|uniref:Cytidine deaminase n=1 Tax=Ridgeia piscesae TaxID=27915 RepID=A0AAD9NQ92_RIDPI|nr:hypothetical protein NP493_545g01123 [Ridgeia piscesae]